MFVILLAATLQISTLPHRTELAVSRVRFQDSETREYQVEGGLGTRCSFVSVDTAASMRLDCQLGEFYAEFDRSMLHMVATITNTSICLTKQPNVSWFMLEAWLSVVMQRHLFPDREIRFIDRGVAKQIPKSHQNVLNALPSDARPQ